MKRIFLLILGCFLLSSALLAQSSSPVVLIASSGKLRYQSPNSKKAMKVVDGAVLQAEGQLLLKPGSEATLFQNSHFATLKTAGKMPLTAPFVGVDPDEALLNFELTYSSFVMAAVQAAASDENQEAAWGGIKTSSKTGDGWGGIKTGVKTGDGWGGIKTSSKTGDGWGNIRTGSKTGDGWGGKGSKITAIYPFGKMLPAASTFSWSQPAGKLLFTLHIRDATGNTVLEQTTQDTSLQINLSVAPFVPGASYTWWVSRGEEAAGLSSNKVAIQLIRAEEVDEGIRPAKAVDLYQQSSPAVQATMEAIALERASLFVAAEQAYLRARVLSPKSEFVRLMHAAFWMRNGTEEMASRAYRGK